MNIFKTIGILYEWNLPKMATFKEYHFAYERATICIFRRNFSACKRLVTSTLAHNKHVTTPLLMRTQ